MKKPGASAKPRFGALKVKPKQGNETFHARGRSLEFTVLDFWKWTASNLLSNTSRGNLAEFLVGRALGIKGGIRATWDNYDLMTPGGVKVEVKSSAYLQVWGQKRLSRPTFGIGPSRAWDVEKGRSKSKAKRHADVYVFCLLDQRDQKKLDPLDLDQWTFRVLSVKVLNRKCPKQKTIGWNKLEGLGAKEAKFKSLRQAVMAALTGKH